MCSHINEGDVCAKIDLSQAYRSVPVAPSNFCATGLKWKFKGGKSYTYMYDNKLCFGASKAPGIFQRITESVTRMMKRMGYDKVFVYLDDFIIVADSYEGCMKAFVCLTQLLFRLGFTINWKKVIPPTQNIVFLGVLIDTINCTLTIPSDKLCALQEELKLWIGKTKATKHQLQQIIGKLNWAAKLLHATRPFLRRLIDLMCILKRPSHRIRLTKSVKDDLQWLLTASSVFNGTVAIVKKAPSPEFSFASDACGAGGAAFYRGEWFYVNWSIDFPQVESAHINLKELFTVVLAMKRWCNLWENKHITVYTDNQVTMYAINKGSVKNSFVTRNESMFIWIFVHLRNPINVRQI